MRTAEVEVLARAQHAVDDLLDEGQRVEVLDGMLVVQPPPSLGHNRVVASLYDLLRTRLPEGLLLDAFGLGVFLHDGADAEYQQPDVTVFRPRPGMSRVVGADVELVVEVVSPANRRHRDYERSVVDRAVRYGIGWVLVVDPDARTLRWWRDGQDRPEGPAWVGALELTW